MCRVCVCWVWEVGRTIYILLQCKKHCTYWKQMKQDKKQEDNILQSSWSHTHNIYTYTYIYQPVPFLSVFSPENEVWYSHVHWYGTDYGGCSFLWNAWSDSIKLNQNGQHLYRKGNAHYGMCTYNEYICCVYIKINIIKYAI